MNWWLHEPTQPTISGVHPGRTPLSVGIHTHTTVECPFFYFRVRKISTFTAFLDVFWLNYALLRIQSCRSKALINALAYLRILLNLHFAIDKLENSYKRLIFQPSPLWTAALHRFSSEDLSNKHPPTHLTIGKQLDSNSQK